MLRYAVTFGYVLAAVLAPKVCCCALNPAAETGPQRTAAVAEVRAKTCPHCRTPEKSPDDSQPVDKPKCPCKEGRSHEAPAVVTAPASIWLDAPSGLSVIGFIDRLPAPVFAAT